MSTTVQGPSPALPVFFQNSQNSQGSQESGYDDAIEDWSNDPVFERQQARPLALSSRPRLPAQSSPLRTRRPHSAPSRSGRLISSGPLPSQTKAEESQGFRVSGVGHRCSQPDASARQPTLTVVSEAEAGADTLAIPKHDSRTDGFGSPAASPAGEPDGRDITAEGHDMLGANSTSILAYLDTPHSSPGQIHRAVLALPGAASFGDLALGGSNAKPCGADAGADPDTAKPCFAFQCAPGLSAADAEEGNSRFFSCAHGAAPSPAFSELAPLTGSPGSLPSMEYDANTMFSAFKHVSFDSPAGAGLGGRSAMGSPLSSSSLSSSASAYGLHMDAAAYHINSESAPSQAVLSPPAGGGRATRNDLSSAPAVSASLPSQLASPCGTHGHGRGSAMNGLLLYAQQHDSRGSLRVTAAPFKPSPASSPPLGSPAPDFAPSVSYDGRPVSMSASASQQDTRAATLRGSNEWGDAYANAANSDLVSGACRGSKLPTPLSSPYKSPLSQSMLGSACGGAGAMPLALGGIMGGSVLTSAGGLGFDGSSRSADAGSNYGGGGAPPQRFGPVSAFAPALAPAHHLPAGADRRPQPPLSPPHGSRGTPPPSLPGAMGGPWNTAGHGSSIAPCPMTAQPNQYGVGRRGHNPHTPLPASFSHHRPHALGGSGAGSPAMDPQAMAAFNNMCSAVGLNQMQMLNLQHLVMQLAHATTNKQELRKLLQGYLSQERVAEAHVLVGMMRLVGLPVDVVMYNLLMTAYKKRRQWQLVMQVMQQMQSSHVVPDTVSYNILIDACGKAQQLHRAFEFYDEMVRQGLQPGVNTYTSLIDACGKTQQLKRAHELLNQMQEEGVQPNAHTFTTIINACAQAQDLEMGLQVLEQMIRCGAAHDVGQTTVTPYTTLIRACGKAFAVDKAFAVLRCMLEVGLKPNTVTFNCLIDACSRANELDKAFKVLAMMYHYDNPPDAITYTALVDACVKGGALDRAYDLLRQMRREEHTPSSSLYTSLLDACVRAAEIDKAFEVLHGMGEASARPAVATCTALVQACGRASSVERAFDTVRYMKYVKVRPNAATYTALIDACVQARDFGRAMTALQEMLMASEVPEPAVFNALIELCGGSGQVDYAYQIFLYMRQLSVIPNSLTFRGLIAVSLKCGDVQRAEQTVDEMAAAGWEPDSATAESLLTACASRAEVAAGLPRLLQRLMPCIEHKQRSPLLARLAETLAAGKMYGLAMQIVGYLQAEPSPPDVQLVAALRSSLASTPALGGTDAGRALFNTVSDMLTPAHPAPSAAAPAGAAPGAPDPA